MQISTVQYKKITGHVRLAGQFLEIDMDERECFWDTPAPLLVDVTSMVVLSSEG